MKHKERLLWLVALLMLMPIGAKALQILAVPLGGTGQSSYGTAGQFLQSQGSPSPAVWASVTSTSAGSTGQIQIAGAGNTFTANSGLTSDTSGNLTALSVTATNKLIVGTGIVTSAIVNKTSAYTTTASDYIVTCSSGTFTVTLVSAPATGTTQVIKNTGTGVITVAPSAGTIDGASTQVLAVRYTSITVVYDGSNWDII